MSNVNHRKLSSNPKAMQVLRECIRHGFTDRQIQDRLIKECGYKWSVDTVSRRRRALGIVKTKGGTSDISLLDKPNLSMPPHGLSDTEKAAWFTGQFKKTHLYITIKKQFELDELATYLTDFGLLCCQFEDIVISEFMQIDDFLKHRILVDRQLILIREIQRQITEKQDWLMGHPISDDEDQDMKKSRIRCEQQIKDKHSHLKVVNDRYDALVKERQRIYSGLAATRKDRLDELRGGKETFLELIGRLQHSQEERDRQGQLAELTRLSAEDVKKEFREPVEFPDGSVEPIIMDSETNFQDEDYE